MQQGGLIVVFKHENEDFVLQNEQIALGKYYREYSGKKVVDFISKSSHIHVRMFFKFLQNGDVPRLFEDQIQVLQLLKEWDCNFLVYNSYRFLIQSQPRSEELNQFFIGFSKKNTEDFFSLNCNHLKEFSERFEEAQQNICELKSINNDLEMEIAELYQHKKRKEIEDQQKIEGLMKKLCDLEKSMKEMVRRKEEEGKRHHEEQEKKNIEEEKEKEEKGKILQEELEKQRKQKEDNERIEKWKTTQPSDFCKSIFGAVSHGKLSSVVYLLEHGTNVNTRDSFNDTPLHLAAQNGHLSVVEYLVKQKAEINAKGYRNLYPLHLAAQNGHLSVVEYLVNQKADINAKTDYNHIPLHRAALNGHLSVVEYLVNQKSNINANSNSNQTPLHLASLNGHLSVVEYLVNQKSELNVKDNSNKTPLQLAAQNSHLLVVEYLKNKGAF